MASHHDSPAEHRHSGARDSPMTVTSSRASSLLIVSPPRRPNVFQPGEVLPHCDLRQPGGRDYWADEHGVFAVRPVRGDRSETSIARFVRPAWLNPDMLRDNPISQIFPAVQHCDWIASPSEFGRNLGIDLDTYYASLFNLEGLIRLRQMIPTTSLHAALVLAIGDLAVRDVWLSTVLLSGRGSYAGNMGGYALPRDRYLYTRYQVWIVHWPAEAHWTAVVLDTDRERPGAFYYDSLVSGRPERMETFRAGAFREWFGHFGMRPEMLDAVRWTEVDMKNQPSNWECGLLVAEAIRITFRERLVTRADGLRAAGWQSSSFLDVNHPRTGDLCIRWTKAIRAQFNTVDALRAGRRVDRPSDPRKQGDGVPACAWDEGFADKPESTMPNWKVGGMVLGSSDRQRFDSLGGEQGLRGYAVDMARASRAISRAATNLASRSGSTVLPSIEAGEPGHPRQGPAHPTTTVRSPASLPLGSSEHLSSPGPVGSIDGRMAVDTRPLPTRRSSTRSSSSGEVTVIPHGRKEGRSAVGRPAATRDGRSGSSRTSGPESDRDFFSPSKGPAKRGRFESIREVERVTSLLSRTSMEDVRGPSGKRGRRRAPETESPSDKEAELTTPARQQPMRSVRRNTTPVQRPSILEFEDMKSYQTYPSDGWVGAGVFGGSVVAGWPGWTNFNAMRTNPGRPRLVPPSIPPASR